MVQKRKGKRNVLLCIIVIFIGCNTIEKRETKTPKSFFENSNISNRFTGVYSVNQMNDLWLFSNSIGESGFLSNSNYDFYIVYSMRRWHEPLKVFQFFPRWRAGGFIGDNPLPCLLRKLSPFH
jgi:hypothetical protein